MEFESNAAVFGALAVGLAAGVLLAFLVMRRRDAGDRDRVEQLESELAQTREELEAGREEVGRHFRETSDLFRDLTEQYSKLYAHLSSGARSFCEGELPALAQLDTPQLETPKAPDDDRAAKSAGSQAAKQQINGGPPPPA